MGEQKAKRIYEAPVARNLGDQGVRGDTIDAYCNFGFFPGWCAGGGSPFSTCSTGSNYGNQNCTIGSFVNSNACSTGSLPNFG